MDNLQLRCRAHNANEAAQYFGSSTFREHSIDYQLGPDRVADAPLAADRQDVRPLRRFEKMKAG